MSRYFTIASGIHAVEAVLQRTPDRVETLLLRDGRLNTRLANLQALAQAVNVRIERVPAERLDQLAEGARHQGVAVRYQSAPVLNEAGLMRLLDELDASPLLLLLDGVTDPHNLGACLRTADATGVDAVVVPRDQAAGLTPTVRKIASGAAESVPFVQVTNLARTMDQLKKRGIWITGAADAAASSLYQHDLTGPLAIAMGAEGKGLRRMTRERCDFLVSIPMLGQVESLNVSVATGVMLYEALRQRKKT